MDLRNCAECGALYAYTGRNICSKCLDKEEEQYKKVRRYVRDHPGASIYEVSQETAIEEEKILQFIRDGRLQSQGFKGVLECEGCGKSISAGRLCEDCIIQRDMEIRGVLHHAGKEPAPEKKTRNTSERVYVREGKK